MPVFDEPPRLLELQRWMRWVIVDPRGVGPALADPHPGHEEALQYPTRYVQPTRSLLHFISDAPPLDAPERLEIYAEAYFIRLSEVLADDFAATRAILDERSFRKLVADFLKAHPSSSFNITEAGERLPEFLANYRHAVPGLADVARLERAVLESYFADDAPRLEPSVLLGVAPEAWPAQCFKLGASVRLLSFSHDVEPIWREQAENPGSESVQRLAREAALSPGTFRVLVFREPSGLVALQRLERAPFEVLRAMNEGANLGQICEKLEPDPSGEFPPLMKWFSEWVSGGVIGSIHGENS